MKEIDELNKSKIPIVVINSKLNKYDDIVLFPKKLEEANETLAKYGLPEAWGDVKKEIEAEKAFWIRGILKSADADKNTFSLVVTQTTDKQSYTRYTINTVPEILEKLVKENWGGIINVHIQTKIRKGKQYLYELIEVTK